MSYIDNEFYKEKYDEVAEELEIACNMINNYEEERKRNKKKNIRVKKKNR